MRAPPLAPLLLLAAALGADETPDAGREVAVTLTAGVPRETERLGYSRPRKLDIETTVPRFLFEVPEFQDKQPLFFRLSLGETKGVPFYGAIDRAADAAQHNLLHIDRNRDLDLTNDGPPVLARVRGLFTADAKIVEFLDVTLPLPYSVEGKEGLEPYACVLFYVIDAKTTVPAVLLLERDGWREGKVAVEGEEYALALVDDDSDGQFSNGDSWVLRLATTTKAEMLGPDATRSMLFPSWTADQKWTVEVKSIDPAGRTATLRIAAAKETEMDFFVRVARQRQTEEEKQLNLDPLRPKADGNSKIDWIEGKDVAYALDICNSPKVQKPLLLEFMSRACPWCAKMEQYTFRDREVVSLADRFVCAKIPFVKDGDDAKKYRAEGTPTYVILDRKGAEIARHQGFLRPTEFAAWLKSALR
jgi:thioredoxin-related protein